LQDAGNIDVLTPSNGNGDCQGRELQRHANVTDGNRRSSLQHSTGGLYVNRIYNTTWSKSLQRVGVAAELTKLDGEGLAVGVGRRG
jgi:hypothetical protein